MKKFGTVSEPGFTPNMLITSLISSTCPCPLNPPSATPTLNWSGKSDIVVPLKSILLTISLLVSEPSVNVVSSPVQIVPPPVNLKYGSMKLDDDANKLIEDGDGLLPSWSYSITKVSADNETVLPVPDAAVQGPVAGGPFVAFPDMFDVCAELAVQLCPL